MSESRLDELLCGELDDQLTAADQTELQRILETSEHAGVARREYQQLDQLLRDLPAQLPPASLHHRIAADVRLPKANAADEQTWLSSLWLSPVARVSFAAVAGVLFSLAIFNAVGPDLAEAPTRDMLGSMVPQQGERTGDILDQLQITGVGFATGAALLQFDQQLVLGINLDATGPVDIAVDFGDTGIQFKSLAGPNNGIELVRYTAPVLHLRGTGTSEIRVLLSREEDATAAQAASIQLEFSSNGQAAERGSLSIVQ